MVLIYVVDNKYTLPTHPIGQLPVHSWMSVILEKVSSSFLRSQEI